jgi:hypothetical protein
VVPDCVDDVVYVVVLGCMVVVIDGCVEGVEVEKIAVVWELDVVGIMVVEMDVENVVELG